MTPIASLGPSFQPPWLRFVVCLSSLFWGRVRTRHGSTLSSACKSLFGARFSPATVQLCRLLVRTFLGPGERPPRLRFVVESPFWGQVLTRHGSTLSSACSRLFGAVFLTAQVCRLFVIAFWCNLPRAHR